MSTAVQAHRSGFWAWPGPARMYELVIVGAVYLPVLKLFGKSAFAMALVTVLTICLTLLHGSLRKDVSPKAWKTFNLMIWIVRAAALGAGVWLFRATPGQISWRIVTVVIYVALYTLCESRLWRRKEAVEAAHHK